MTIGTTAGRALVRPAALAGLGLAVAAALGVAVTRHGDVARGPISVPTPKPDSALVTVTDGVRHTRAGVPPERLLPDSIPPHGRSRLVFFQGRATHPDRAGGVYTLDGAGGILRVDARLTAQRIPVSVDGREIVSVAPAGEEGLWLVSGEGEVIRVDRGGFPVSIAPGPFDYSLVAADRAGTPFFVRSPVQTAFRPAFGSTPLLARGPDPEERTWLGQGVVPADFLLSHLASSGRIAIGDSAIYYAPFIRDEVVALTRAGDTLWITTRGLPQSRPEPRFEVIDGEPVVDYAPVNLGIALGPDGRLYVLSVPGETVSEGRLDVLDPATGDLIRSARFDDPLPTLAVDGEGRVYRLDAFQILTGVPARDRQPFTAFELPLLSGGTMSSDHLRGRVTLINFWASWCAPCRDEMPELDALTSSILHPDFQFLTMNEDINPQDAVLFLQDYDFSFPVLLGRGELKREYHYVGLPFTVLVDRNGHVAHRWIGYGGPPQIDAVRALIDAELAYGVGAKPEGHAHGSRVEGGTEPGPHVH